MHILVLKSRLAATFTYIVLKIIIYYMRMKYSTKERVFIVKEYTKKANISSVQSTWRSHFKVKTAPSRSVILYNNDIRYLLHSAAYLYHTLLYLSLIYT